MNGAPSRMTRSFREILSANLLTYFNFVNLVLFILVCLTGEYRNALFMGTVVFNAFMGIKQELKAKKLLDQMSIMVETKTEILRNDEWISLPTSEIVKDDIFRIKAGNQIPADGIVMEGSIEVNESMLSGESDIVVKTENDKVYAGTIVTADHALIQATNVGKECTASKIMADAQRETRARSVLRSDLDKMIRMISFIIIPVGITLFLVQHFSIHLSRNEAILKTVAALVGMIPEGLVVLTSIALTLSVIREAKQNVLVQDLFSIESFARIDTVCLDKTGTLTTGNMKVVDVIPYDISLSQFSRILSSYLYQMQDINATSLALSDHFHEEEIFKKKDVLSFSSERKYAACLLEEAGAIYIGAYESLFPEKDKDPLIEEYAKKGQRVVVAAKSNIFMKQGLPEDLAMIGIIVLEDEIRTNAADIIQYFIEEGLSIRILSGDDPETVSSLARLCGIPYASDYVDMSKPHEDCDELIQKYSIFARVRPEEKKQLIMAMQKEGHHVLMCGDGVNDVSALKCADASAAMNAGSDAAKNTANVVLLDDDFALIPSIIEEGRRVINNISRASSMYFVKTIFSVLLSVYVILFQEAYPFLPIQLTFIGAIGVGIPTFVLQMEPCFEKIEGDFMKKAFEKALPSAIAISLTVIICLWMQDVLHYTDARMNAIFVFLTAYIYICTLLRIYFPFTKLRIGIIALMCISLICILFFFGHLISVSFHLKDFWILFIGMILEPLIIYILVKCLSKIESMVKQYGTRRKN